MRHGVGICDGAGVRRGRAFNFIPCKAVARPTDRPTGQLRMYVHPVRAPTVIEYSIGFTKAGRGAVAPCGAARGVARRNVAWCGAARGSRSTGHTPIFDPRQKLRGGSADGISNGR